MPSICDSAHYQSKNPTVRLLLGLLITIALLVPTVSAAQAADPRLMEFVSQYRALREEANALWTTAQRVKLENDQANYRLKVALLDLRERAGEFSISTQQYSLTQQEYGVTPDRRLLLLARATDATNEVLQMALDYLFTGATVYIQVGRIYENARTSLEREAGVVSPQSR